MSIQKRIKSVRFAINGIGDLIRSQPNARVHLLAIFLVCTAGRLLQVSKQEWIALVFCMTLVLSLEAVNTALEYLTDLVSPDYHPLAGKAKDVAAAAVLIAAIGSVIVGLLVFGPRIAFLL